MLAEEVFWFWILKFKLISFHSFLLMGNISIILKWAEIIQISLDVIYCFLSLHFFHLENRVICDKWISPLWCKEASLYTQQKRPTTSEHLGRWANKEMCLSWNTKRKVNQETDPSWLGSEQRSRLLFPF